MHTDEYSLFFLSILPNRIINFRGFHVLNLHLDCHSLFNSMVLKFPILKLFIYVK